jgi:predicted Zn-dependent protease
MINKLMLGVCLVVNCFYSGILPVTKDDAGLATVMGHEVSHSC